MTFIIAEREARLMIVQCGVEIWVNVCMYVCKISCYWAPHVNLFVWTPRTMRNTCSILQSTSHVLSQYLYGETQMKCHWSWTAQETADGRVIGRGEWSPTSRRGTYVALSVWRVNSSSVLKKPRNTGSKPTFDSIYRYRHSHHLSTERLDCLLRGWRQR